MFEFDPSEIWECSFCGHEWPVEEMYVLEDGRFCCEECWERMREEGFE